MKKCIEDIKDDIILLKSIQIQQDLKLSEQEKLENDKSLENLLNNEKILTLIYDKAFYNDNKKALANAYLQIEDLNG